MTTDSNRALVEGDLEWLRWLAATYGDPQGRVDRILAALVPAQALPEAEYTPITVRSYSIPAQEVAGLVEEALMILRWVGQTYGDPEGRIDRILAAISPPTQGADRLELAAADDNREALGEWIPDSDAVCATCRWKGGHSPDCARKDEPWPMISVAHAQPHSDVSVLVEAARDYQRFAMLRPPEGTPARVAWDVLTQALAAYGDRHGGQ